MTKFTKITASLATAIALTVSAGAMADADLYTAKGCAACHGADANSPITPMYPKIGGQSVEYATQQMTDIKSGARNNGQTAAMKAIMASVSEEEIAKLATYLSGL